MKSLETYNVDKDKVKECIDTYYNFTEDLNSTRTSQKIINDFLADLPYSSSITQV
jgi:hypothetical protein